MLTQANQVLAEKNGTLAETQQAYASALAELAIVQRDYDILTAIPLSTATVSGIKTKVYTGEAVEQPVVVKVDGKTLQQDLDYTLAYENNVEAGKGKATVTITGMGHYSGTVEKTFTIKKAPNRMTLSAKSKSVKATTVKKKKVSLKGLVVATNAQGKVKFANASKGKALKVFKVNAKNGAITVAKGTKVGTYKVKVKARAKGDSNYKATTKRATVRIRVK